MTVLRSFWLTLFAIAAVFVLAMGWVGGEPWTAAAFVMFFTSRVARSEQKRRWGMEPAGDPVQRAHRFTVTTAAGWIGAGILATVAALAGEGQEWLFVAPFFLAMGAINLYVALR